MINTKQGYKTVIEIKADWCSSCVDIRVVEKSIDNENRLDWSKWIHFHWTSSIFLRNCLTYPNPVIWNLFKRYFVNNYRQIID